MNEKTIQDIMNFMLNVQLTGRDVMKFNDCMNALYDELKREDNNEIYHKQHQGIHKEVQ